MRTTYSKHVGSQIDMDAQLTQLLRTRRFLPLFLTQFLQAFNDAAFKNAMVIAITYNIAMYSVQETGWLLAAAAGIFVFPFLLFSALAGQLADKYDKALITRIVKASEILLMAGAAYAFFYRNVSMLYFILFLMGTHTTFFAPIKFAILPDHLRHDQLLGANALIEASTFLAILVGTIMGGVLVSTTLEPMFVSSFLISVAVCGWISSFFIPKTQPGQKHLKIHWNLWQETWRIINHTRKQSDVFLAILGISWFWLIGAIFLSQLPNYSKVIIGGSASLANMLLAFLTIGIGFGSLLMHRLLKGEVNTNYVPISLLGMSVFSFDLCFASPSHVDPQTKIGVITFLSYFNNWRIMFDLTAMATCGGMYTVPLYAYVQSRASRAHRARIIASNNIINSVFMIGASILMSVLIAIHFTIPQIFMVLAGANLVVAIYICKLLPHAIIQSYLKWALRSLFRVKVENIHHYHDAGKRTVIIANHSSYLDMILLAAFTPDRLMFAINAHQAKRWWMKPILFLVDAYPIDPAKPFSTKTLIHKIRRNRRCVIFPEGRLTVTGSLMKVYEGPGMIADKAGATILPIRIRGAVNSPFTRLRGKVAIRAFPQITLTFLPPEKISLSESLSKRERRQVIGRKLYDIMINMLFNTSDYDRTLYEALLETISVQKRKRKILEDIERKPISYGTLLLKTQVLGCVISRQTKINERVGVILPNTIPAVITFFALQAYGRTPAMLNYTAGPRTVGLACQLACIKTIYTSKRFIKVAELQPIIDYLQEMNVTIIYLESLKKEITIKDKLLGIWRSHSRSFYDNRIRPMQDHNDPAVILFTSGSEGKPKGVALSHKNILSNRYQISSIIDFIREDIIFNALPIFHSFGLTAGMILPLITGMRTFFYPSPLHYRIIPELIYDTNATVLFGTNTFLMGYARYAHHYDFYSIRYVVAGAEKLRDETRKLWHDKFGIRILEGYGATETSPVLSVNTPLQNKSGSVGRLVPGIEYKIEDVEGIKQGGRLLVRGPNIMRGYLRAEDPGVLYPPKNGWYDTGDIVDVDEDGFITILGRAKRFAKIAGEMVSLTAVEEAIHKVWPDNLNVVVSLPDLKKGEQLVLVTDQADATLADVLQHFREQQITELAMPKKIVIVEQVPLLGSGKINYPQTTELVLEEA